MTRTYRLLQKWTKHRKSSSNKTDPNTVENYRLIDLVIRIEFTRAILMLRLSNFLKDFDHPFSHAVIFGNMFLRVAVSLLYDFYKLYQRYMFQFIPM